MAKAPAIFVGHGSPMNAIEDNIYTRGFADITKRFDTPKAILAVSAHWYTAGHRVNDEDSPNMIYDMYGFPQELYQLKYPAKGAPNAAGEIKKLLAGEVITDNGWGIDHGTWSVLVHMYPNADIPVVSLSVDLTGTPKKLFDIGSKLKQLRDDNILILGSGNIVHNLRNVNWNMQNGYDYAYEFDGYIKQNILKGDYDAVQNYHNAGDCAKKAFPTLEHFYPLYYVLGASGKSDDITVFNEGCLLGSISMTSYMFK